MRRYELALVADPTIPEEQHDRLITAFEELITGRSGKVLKVDRWGRRKLAYRIKGQTEGNYTFLLFDGETGLLQELERRIRLSENWLRYSTVRADHEKPPTEEELEALQEARQEQIRRAKEREERERQAREQAEAEGAETGEAEAEQAEGDETEAAPAGAEAPAPEEGAEEEPERKPTAAEEPVEAGEQRSEEDES
jgi:small subunit ribosomal protein S6